MVGATSVEIKKKALEEGMLTLRMSGLEKIKAGVTTVEEVLRGDGSLGAGIGRDARGGVASRSPQKGS